MNIDEVSAKIQKLLDENGLTLQIVHNIKVLPKHVQLQEVKNMSEEQQPGAASAGARGEEQAGKPAEAPKEEPKAEQPAESEKSEETESKPEEKPEETPQ